MDVGYRGGIHNITHCSTRNTAIDWCYRFIQEIAFAS